MIPDLPSDPGASATSTSSSSSSSSNANTPLPPIEGEPKFILPNIIEDWYIGCHSVDQAFETLEKLFDPQPNVYDFRGENLDQVFSYVRLALHQADQDCLPEKTRLSLNTLPTKIIQWSEDPLRHPPEHIKKLTKILGCSSLLRQHLTNLCLRFTPHPVSQNIPVIDSAIEWANYACHFYPAMPKEIQRTLQGLIGMFPLFKESEIKRDPQLARIHAIAVRVHVIAGEYATEQDQTPLPKPTAVQNPIDLSEWESQSPVVLNRELLQKQEHLIFLNTLAAQVVEHYFLRAICTQPSTLELLPLIMEELKEHLSFVGQQLLLPEIHNLRRSEKGMILSVARWMNYFFGDLIKVLPDSADPSTILSQDFTNIMHSKIEQRAKVSLSIDELLFKGLQRVLRFVVSPDKDLRGPPSRLDQMAVTMTAAFVFDKINRLTSPEIAPFVLEQLMTRDIPHAKMPSEKPPPKCYPACDELFSARLGGEINEITMYFLALGDKSVKMNLVRKVVSTAFSSQKKAIGTLAQRWLNCITSSELNIKPFQILRTLLFKEDEEGIHPIFKKHLNMTREERVSYCKRAEEAFSNRLYPYLIDTIQSMNPSGASAMRTLSPREFCHSLGSKVFKITQNPQLVKIMLTYLLNGIEKALIEEHNHRLQDALLHLSPPRNGKGGKYIFLS